MEYYKRNEIIAITVFPLQQMGAVCYISITKRRSIIRKVPVI